LYLNDLAGRYCTVFPIRTALVNTATKFYGKGFIATKEEGEYFIAYQLARHGGGNRKFEITEEIYEDARTGKHSTSSLFKEYNLYHLDVPENDIK
jgi:hypothetical protein